MDMKINKNNQIVLYKWANEGNKQVMVKILEKGDVEISFVEAPEVGKPAKEYAKLTLASYRAKDIAEAILSKLSK